MVPLRTMLSRIALPIATASGRVAIMASVLAASALAWGACAGGCGPSLRLVEQSNLYFERCHAADLDPVRTDTERRACWQAWRDHYDVGQSADRDDYVRERLVMLDPQNGSAITLSTADELGTAGSEPDAEVEAAPPEGPELSDTIADRPPRPRRRPVVPRTRTSACGVGCEPAFVTCGTACNVGDRGCVEACRHIYRQCARGCF